jgi:hypothetical protein
MQKSLRMAEPFILGCPACLQNFRNLFCTLFCSPDQATFTNVTAVQQAPPAPRNTLSTVTSGDETWAGVGGAAAVAHGVGLRAANVTAVKEVAFFLSEEFKNATYMSCSNVVFGAANTHAMLFIGNGATTAQVHAPSRTVALMRSHVHLHVHTQAAALIVIHILWYPRIPSCALKGRGEQKWQHALRPALTGARAQQRLSRHRALTCRRGSHFESPSAISRR